jgi:hypothetical protein
MRRANAESRSPRDIGPADEALKYFLYLPRERLRSQLNAVAAFREPGRRRRSRDI